MEEEKRAMSPQVLSIIAGNTSLSSTESAYAWWSAPLAPHSTRWDADAWRAAMSATLGYCPPGLEHLAPADDPIMRKALSHKTGGTAIKRHNGVVHVQIGILSTMPAIPLPLRSPASTRTTAALIPPASHPRAPST